MKEEIRTAQKTADKPQAAREATGRKPWVKKSPVDIVLEQRDKQKKKVAEIRTVLAQEEETLRQFEEAAKAFKKP